MKSKLFSIVWANRLWVVLAFAVLAGWGLRETARLPVDAVPDITGVQVVVNTKTGALDPEQIEKAVTYIIETELSGLPEVQDIRSISKYGLSQVTVVFRDGKDMYLARQQVFERLNSIEGNLPQGLVPEMGPVTTGLGEIFMYAVLAKPESALAKKPEAERLTYLRTVQDYTIRPQLRRVNGIADVDSNGGFKQEIHVNLFPARMQQYGVTLEQVTAKLETLGENYGGGTIERGGRQVIVRTAGAIASLEQVRNVPVHLNAFGRQIRVRDIAEVRIDHAQRLGAATFKGDEAVLGTALMRTGANSMKAARDVAKALTEVHLPDDVTTEVLYNRSALVDATIHTVLKNLIEGAALVVVVLLLLLGNLRAAVLVALSIPLSMLFAVTGMNSLGISANLMSLGAVDFGLLVDASIVVIENYLQKLEKFHGQKTTLQERAQWMGEALSEIIRPVSTGILIIMIVYIPILSLEGIEGKMFHPMAYVVLMALLASLATALFFMPVAGALLLKPPAGKAKEVFFFSLFSNLYKPVFRIALRLPLPLAGVSLGVGVVAVFLYMRLGADFIPQLDEGDLVIGLVRDSEMSLENSVHWQRESEKVIAQFPEVEKVFSRIGTPESATDPMSVNFADTFVVLKSDKKSWPLIDGKRRSKAELFIAIEKKLSEDLPIEQEISPTQPIEMRFNEMLEGSRADLTLRILGNDLDELMALIEKAIGIIEGVDGAAAVEMDELTALTASPVLDVRLDHTKLLHYGVDLREASEALETAMSGRVLGSMYLNGIRFPLKVHMDERLRGRLKEIARIPVSLSDGGSIPLSRLVTFEENRQVTKIAHSYARRYAAVSVYIEGRDIESFVQEAQGKIDSELKLPAGYETWWGGQFRNLLRARERLALIVPATLIVIFLLVLRTLGSLSDTLLVFSGIPLAVTGGVFTLYLRGMNFSVSAAIGFIVLMGISILNTLVLLNVYRQMREQGMRMKDIVWEGTLSRLRPVLMTALVASLGFLPMALNTGLGSEVQRPLATVVVGGLITSTLLTLLLLPALVLYFGEREEKKKNL